MREILFRGRRVDNGEWVYGWYTEYCFGRWPLKPCIIPSELAHDGEVRHCEVDPSTVGQFTGLTDMTGKRIFEGDLIRVKWDYDVVSTYKIEYDPELAAYIGTSVHPDDDSFCTLNSDRAFYEVIGTIHDNYNEKEDAQ